MQKFVCLNSTKNFLRNFKKEKKDKKFKMLFNQLGTKFFPKDLL